MAVTSPTLFMQEPKPGSTVENSRRSQRGTFATTQSRDGSKEAVVQRVTLLRSFARPLFNAIFAATSARGWPDALRQGSAVTGAR